MTVSGSQIYASSTQFQAQDSVTEDRRDTTPHQARTLQAVSMSVMAFLPELAAAMTSSWRQLLPAATARAVAWVTGLVARISSSGVTWRVRGQVSGQVWTERRSQRLQRNSRSDQSRKSTVTIST